MLWKIIEQNVSSLKQKLKIWDLIWVLSLVDLRFEENWDLGFIIHISTDPEMACFILPDSLQPAWPDPTSRDLLSIHIRSNLNLILDLMRPSYLTMWIIVAYITIGHFFPTSLDASLILHSSLIVVSQHLSVLMLIQEQRTLEKSCIPVTCVTSVFHLGAAYIAIRMFIPASTSARNVASVWARRVHWQHTCELIQDRNHLSVLFVTNSVQPRVAFWNTAEFIMEISHAHVQCVTRPLLILDS